MLGSFAGCRGLLQVCRALSCDICAQQIEMPNALAVAKNGKVFDSPLHRVLQVLCVAVCCSVWQCVAVCCSVLQCVVVCCSVLQCVVMCCSVLQCVAVCCSVLAVCCSAYVCVAVCCSVLQCVGPVHAVLQALLYIDSDSFVCVT